MRIRCVPDGVTGRVLEGYFVRFVLAIGAFILAALCIGAGIAQRTVFLGPETHQVSASTTGDAAYTLVDGAVLNSTPGAQTLMVRGEGTVFASYGRTADIEAWLSDATYNTISLTKSGELKQGLVEATAPVAEVPADAATPDAAADPEAAAAAAAAAPAAVPGGNPSGSYLWFDEFKE